MSDVIPDVVFVCGDVLSATERTSAVWSRSSHLTTQLRHRSTEQYTPGSNTTLTDFAPSLISSIERANFASLLITTQMSTKALTISLSVVLVALAVVRSLFPAFSKDRIDLTSIVLVGVAFIVQLIPLERLRSIKAAGIEFGIDDPQVDAAINALSADRIGNVELRDRLKHMSDDLEVIRGSRVLWIDDKPGVVLNARRLLRALGIEVIPATSSVMAENILGVDQDFDVLISDVQRQGDSYKLNKGIDIHEGVNFVVKLRRSGDAVLHTLPVIFFAAYDWERLMHFTRPAREFAPEAEVSNSVNDFVEKVIKRLAERRRKPILYPAQKEPTPP